MLSAEEAYQMTQSQWAGGGGGGGGRRGTGGMWKTDMLSSAGLEEGR